MMLKPRCPLTLSVVMPVYNAAQYVGAAIASLLQQSFTDFEMIIVNDGSTDGSNREIKRIFDPRIRLIEFDSNRGVVDALNAGLDHARGRLIARMDADDLSRADRFARQVRFLDRHPNIGIVGTGWTFFGTRDGGDCYRSTPARLKASLPFGAPFSHPTVMFRRSLIADHGLRYDRAFEAAEDYEMWARFARVTDMANLRAPLLAQRIHGASVSHVHRTRQRQSAARARQGIMHWIMAAAPDADSLALHERIIDLLNDRHGIAADEDFLQRSEHWFSRLHAANAQSRRLDPAAFRAVLSEQWYKLCRNSRAAADIFRASPLATVASRARWAGRSIRDAARAA